VRRRRTLRHQNRPAVSTGSISPVISSQLTRTTLDPRRAITFARPWEIDIDDEGTTPAAAEWRAFKYPCREVLLIRGSSHSHLLMARKFPADLVPSFGIRPRVLFLLKLRTNSRFSFTTPSSQEVLADPLTISVSGVLQWDPLSQSAICAQTSVLQSGPAEPRQPFRRLR
jgi:hypothetical protein